MKAIIVVPLRVTSTQSYFILYPTYAIKVKSSTPLTLGILLLHLLLIGSLIRRCRILMQNSLLYQLFRRRPVRDLLIQAVFAHVFLEL